MLGKTKVPTDLLRWSRAREFAGEPIPAHFYELLHEIPIRVGEARYQPHYGVSGF